jgi:flagellar biosynthesis GTPase FlhF
MNFAFNNFNNQTPDYIGIGNQNIFGNTNQNNLFGGNPFFGKNVCTARFCSCYVCKQKERQRQKRVEAEANKKMAKQKEALRRQRVEKEADRKQAKKQEAHRRLRVEKEADRKRVKQRKETKAKAKTNRFWKANGAFFMVSID